MNLNYDSYYGFKKNHNICEEDKTGCILILCPSIPQFRQSINDVFRHVHNIHLRTPHMPDNNRMEKVYILCIGLNILMGRIIKLICFV